MENSPAALPDAETIAQEFKEFAYVVAHDLSAPLRGMVEFSKLLKTEQFDALSDDGKEYISLISESGEKLQKMLGGLLDYSRLNTMGKPLSKVDCNRVLEDCRIVLKDKLEASNAKVDITALPSVMADADQLMQLFLLLVDNALTFHVPGGAPDVSVCAENNEKDWVFTIRDNGIGIEPQFHKRVFQPFQRLHTDSEYPGIGMGLTLAKKIVTRHGGQIWIDLTPPGKGSSFHFTLPHKELS